MSMGVIGEALARGFRYGIGEVYKTEQRKAQEAKALAWMMFDSLGRPDDWPMSRRDDRNEVPENVREEYLRTFGRIGGDGLDRIVWRYKGYLSSGKSVQKSYGLGPIFVAQEWKDAPT